MLSQGLEVLMNILQQCGKDGPLMIIGDFPARPAPEPLNPIGVGIVSRCIEEQSTYEAGLRQLQQEETGDQDILTLQQTRITVAALEAEQARLHARHEQLNAEIVALEAALSERTHQLLGTQGSTVWRTLDTYIYGNAITIAVGTAVYLKRTPGAAQETHIAHLRRLLGFPSAQD
jgi:hypothetical protein